MSKLRDGRVHVRNSEVKGFISTDQANYTRYLAKQGTDYFTRHEKTRNLEKKYFVISNFRPTKKSRLSSDKRNGSVEGKGAEFFIPEENENV